MTLIVVSLVNCEEAEIDAVNRELVELGYKADFDYGIMYGAFITPSYLEYQLNYYNHHPKGNRELPHLMRPITIDTYLNEFPHLDIGHCSIDIETLYHSNCHNLAILIQWIWSHPEVIEQNQGYKYLIDCFQYEHPQIYEYVKNYPKALSAYDHFNRELNKSSQLVLPHTSIRYLFAVQERLEKGDKSLSEPVRQEINELCITYQCRFEIQNQTLYIGRDKMISCGRGLYLDTPQIPISLKEQITR